MKPWELSVCMLILLTLCFQSNAQKYLSRNGFVGFYSKTSLEDIIAENNQAFAVIDTATHQIAFALLVKGFIFRKELMQEHFNENYAESDKYPKTEFNGAYTCSRQIGREGIYPILIK